MTKMKLNGTHVAGKCQNKYRTLEVKKSIIITCEKHYILFSYVRFYGKPIFSIYYVNMEENVKLTIKWNEIGKFNEFYFRHLV